MALNLNTLKTRTLSAIVFVIVMAIGLCWNFYSFILLFSIIHFGCWKEYQSLIVKIDPEYKKIHPAHRYGVIFLGWFIMLFFVPSQLQSQQLSISAIGWWGALILLFILPIIELLLSRHIQPKNTLYSLGGLVYISLSIGFMVYIYHLPVTIFEEGNLRIGILPLVLIASIWINDTMAYIVGSLIGKTPFSPISPKKTWEGTAGGAILAILTVGTIAYFLQMDYIEMGIIATIAAIAGTLGDLFESKLKRMANVKDSGNMMPGHGGFLDRFDSLIFATPFVWLFCWIIYS
ncbi:phosphatidate cytidylyltransferase [Gynurincola endophyticus]|uniref:phosphatidate cytidylyltransferase n=1 Tax=Gynurincola endophyticus TaxID=2479004 RepID=UPI000F8D356E|nr:phosphatidate cytidylyltransferase [Gynurincola endophyticus]